MRCKIKLRCDAKRLGDDTQKRAKYTSSQSHFTDQRVDTSGRALGRRTLSRRL